MHELNTIGNSSWLDINFIKKEATKQRAFCIEGYYEISLNILEQKNRLGYYNSEVA